MRIYTLTCADRTPIVNLSDEDFRMVKGLFGYGEEFKEEWRPLPIKVVNVRGKESRRKLLDYSAIRGISHLPILSDRARIFFNDLLGNSVQWLELSYDTQQYWLVNILKTIPALDAEGSDIKYRLNGEVGTIEKAKLLTDCIGDAALFRLPLYAFPPLVSEVFRRVVISNGITGVGFSPLWDSKMEPFSLYPTKQEILLRPEVYGPGGIYPGFEDAWPVDWKVR